MTPEEIKECERLARLAWPEIMDERFETMDERFDIFASGIHVMASLYKSHAIRLEFNASHPRAAEAMLAALRVMAGESNYA